MFGLVASLVLVCIVLGFSWWRPRHAAWSSALAVLVLSVALAFAWVNGDRTLVNASWFSAMGSRFELVLDPMAAPLALFTSGLTVPILIYTGAYLPERLRQQGRRSRLLGRFCRLMLCFMLAMLVLLLAQDLLLIFAALELTALVSFLLIEFDRHEAEARRSAMVALVVTAGSSLLFLVGLLLLQQTSGTTTLAGVQERLLRAPSATDSVAAACLVAGVVGKSAQVPLHFWLPRAMVAPTPVSAYLHSAALVAAGVFVIARLRPLWEASAFVASAIIVLGAASIVLGSFGALACDGLKRILAYSTIAQYGYMLVLTVVSGQAAGVEVPLVIIAHGVCKCALFLTAGVISLTTGAHKLSECGGMLRSMPVLGFSSALCAAGLAGLPLTIGYFKDELLFSAASEHGPVASLSVSLAVALTFAYMGRFWLGIFMGETRGRNASHEVSLGLLGPIGLLALAVLAGGVWPQALELAFAPRARELGSPLELRYHVSGPTAWMALGAWLLGLFLVLARGRFEELGPALRTRLAPIQTFARLSVAPATRIPELLRRLEQLMLRAPIRFLLVPIAILFGVALLQRQPPFTSLELPAWEQWPIAAALMVTAGAVVTALSARSHIALVLLLSFVGFGVALTFAFAGAPNVALVLVIVETTLTILFLALLSRLRPEVTKEIERRRGHEEARFGWAGVTAFGLALVTAWLALERHTTATSARAHVRLAPFAHAKDVVTAILSDFRGLDTVVELTVLAVAVMGACSIAWGRP